MTQNTNLINTKNFAFQNVCQYKHLGNRNGNKLCEIYAERIHSQQRISVSNTLWASPTRYIPARNPLFLSHTYTKSNSEVIFRLTTKIQTDDSDESKRENAYSDSVKNIFHPKVVVLRCPNRETNNVTHRKTFRFRERWQLYRKPLLTPYSNNNGTITAKLCVCLINSQWLLLAALSLTI
jgi:hypothetical protein